MSKRILPAVALRGLTVFPNMIISFPVGRESSLASLDAAEREKSSVFLVKQIDALEESPDLSGLHDIGTIAHIKQVLKLPGNMTHVIVEGVERAQIDDFFENDGCMRAEIEDIEYRDPSAYDNNPNVQALMRVAKEYFDEYTRLNSRQAAGDTMVSLVSAKTPGEMADMIISGIIVDVEQKQEVLECLDELERLGMVINILNTELEILRLKSSIEEKVKKRMEQNQKEYYLREQLKVIQEELGDKDGLQALSDEFKEKAEERNLPEAVKDVVYKECEKFTKIPATSPESNVVRTYLENIFSLPWTESTEEICDINKSEKILDEDHYGLEKVKERIIEFLAVKQNTKNNAATIICLAGPPGVGKTSVAKSIARATGRNYARMSLGGVKDEAEIRGHRRTYIGAMPGRILSAMKKAKTINPLILLDEVDKLAVSFNGDPAAALLEVLDPEQNSTFCDNYLEMPYDLSKVLFICTANDVSKIPAPLRDRMEVIELSSYTLEEKIQIAAKHLYPKQLKETGLNKSKLKIDKEMFAYIIEGYTKEAGVRNLERIIGKICRKAVKEILSGERKSVKISKNNIEKYLGVVKFKHLLANKEAYAGVVRGLAWTSVGGETLEVEAAVMDGTGKIELTGSMGDVMKESARTAITYIRANAEKYKLDSNFYKDKDIHIHMPEGAVPKDGPSAGVTITTAVLSALTGAKVKNTVAMTGEVTITGRVLAIGGLKEKSIAAMQAGIKTVIIPEENLVSLEEIPEAVKEKVDFVSAQNVEDVFAYAFEKGESIWR
jgi:ATP-dependent Lon protease